MCLALRASGLWLRYATLQNLIPSFPWIAPLRPPPWRNPRKGRDQILPSGNLEGEAGMPQKCPMHDGGADGARLPTALFVSRSPTERTSEPVSQRADTYDSSKDSLYDTPFTKLQPVLVAEVVCERGKRRNGRRYPRRFCFSLDPSLLPLL